MILGSMSEAKTTDSEGDRDEERAQIIQSMVDKLNDKFLTSMEDLSRGPGSKLTPFTIPIMKYVAEMDDSDLEKIWNKVHETYF